MLLHIINETSYHSQSVLVEEGSFALSSILSLLVEVFTLLLAMTVSWSFIRIVIPNRAAAKSIFLTSHGGSTTMELEWVALGSRFLLLIVLDGLTPVLDSKSTIRLTICGILLRVSRQSSISFLCWALSITEFHACWSLCLLLVALPPLVNEIVVVCLLWVPIGILSQQTEQFVKTMRVQSYTLLVLTDCAYAWAFNINFAKWWLNYTILTM